MNSELSSQSQSATSQRIDSDSAARKSRSTRSSEPASIPRRLLVVDDNPDIHEDFRKILSQDPLANAMSEAEAALLDCEPEPVCRDRYEIDCASQGLDAVQRVKAQAEKDMFYSVAFVDIRMPPGVDGVETAQRMWAIDPGLQIVFCTAYSDYTWEGMVRRLGQNHAFLVLKKPFDTIEVRQAALALSEKRRLLRENELSMLDLDSRVKARTAELEVAHANLQQEMQERALLEKGLRQAQKLEALGRLASGIGHEINNPLSYVLNNLELLQHQLAASEILQEDTQLEATTLAVEEALIGAQRIKQVVRGLRLFSQSSESPPSEADVVPCLRAALAMVKSELRHRATLVEDFQDVPHVIGDPPRLEQVFVNLLLNALQAIPKRPSRPGEIQISARCSSEHDVVVHVIDNGCGIAESDLAHIFDPFFSTRPTGEGTGLGLWVCKNVINSFGGSISVESSVGRGTVVQVKLSVSRPSSVVS